jgi:SepF-like predicted cell division protein (DUF552 family)
LQACLTKLLDILYYHKTPRQHLMRQESQTKSVDVTSLNQKLSIKTASIHSYSQLEDLRENVGNDRTIIIAKIAPIVSKHPEAASKLVNELCSAHVENNYSVFRLGEERILIVPQSVQVESTTSN